MSREAALEVNKRRPDGGPPFVKAELLTQVELLEKLVVFGEVFALEVIKQFATTARHLEEAAAAVEVLAMRAQVLGQVIDASREQRDLDVRGTGVLLVGFELGDNF